MPFIYDGESEVWMGDAEASAFLKSNPKIAAMNPDLVAYTAPVSAPKTAAPAPGALPAAAPAPAPTPVDPMAVVRNAGLEFLFAPQIIDENNNMSAGYTPTFNDQGYLIDPRAGGPTNDAPAGSLYYKKGPNGNAIMLDQSGQWVDSGQPFNDVDAGQGGLGGLLRIAAEFGLKSAGAAGLAAGLGGLASLGGAGALDSAAAYGMGGTSATEGALGAADAVLAGEAGTDVLAGSAGTDTLAPEFTGVTDADLAMELAPDPLSNIMGGAPAATGTGPLSNITGNPALSAGTPTGGAATTGGIGLNTAVGGAGAAAAIAGLGGDAGTGLTPPAGALGESLPYVNTGSTTYPTVGLDPGNTTFPTPNLPNIVTVPTTAPTIPTPGALPPANFTPPPDDPSLGDPDDNVTPPPDDPSLGDPADDYNPTPSPDDPSLGDPPPDDTTPPPDDPSLGDPADDYNPTPDPDDPSLGAPADDYNPTPDPDDPSLGDPPDGSDEGLVDYIKKLGKGALTALGFTNADGTINWGKALAAGGLLAGLYQGSKPATSSVKQELPEWYTKGSQEALALAKQYADKGFEPYTGEAIAPLSDNEKLAIQKATDSTGKWEGTAQQGADLVAKGALPVSQDDIRGYVNPAMAGFFGGGQPASPSYSNDDNRSRDFPMKSPPISGALPAQGAPSRPARSQTIPWYEAGASAVGSSPVGNAYPAAEARPTRSAAIPWDQLGASAVDAGPGGTVYAGGTPNFDESAGERTPGARIRSGVEFVERGRSIFGGNPMSVPDIPAPTVPSGALPPSSTDYGTLRAADPAAIAAEDARRGVGSYNVAGVAPTGALPPSSTPSVASMYDEAGNLVRTGTAPLSTTDIARYRNPDLAGITSLDRINATYDEAGNLLRSGAADLTADDIRGLMNPYVDLAYAPAKRALERDLAAKQAIARATAVSRGAFGTDRQTLQDSQLNEAGLTALGDLYGTSYKNAFDSATRLGTEGKGRKLTAGNTMAGIGNSLAGFSAADWTNATNTAKSNLDRSLTGANTMYGAAGILGGLTNTAWGQGINASQSDRDRMIKGGGALSDIATEGSNLTDADIKRLGATGALDRGVRQAQNDFDYGQYQDRLKFPTTAIGNYATALRGAPGSTTTTTPAPPNVAGEAIGALGAWNSWFNTPEKK